ncbi:MAG TPA: integrase, partial [Gammaproteobacteria bacterium]|nr:integrase [Gammaproteobacteria bacterium]
KARFGQATADNRFRSAMGGMVVRSPLERAEIDHTCLDLIVVDEKSGSPLGRPYITACIDCHTRCILGMWVSFDPPSYESVAQCLRHAILPKTNLRERFPETTNEWIAHGVMRTLVVDNGLEFHSNALEKACLELRIELEYAARKSGWLKGAIERYLGSLNRSMLHRVPGTTFSNVLHKGEYASVANAGVRYSTLKQLLVKWVVDIYHQSPHPKLGKPRDEVWRENLDPLDIRYPADIDALDAAIGRAKRLRLTHKGIELFPELFYNSIELADWRRRAGNALRVEVAYSTADLASIIVHGEDGSPIRVPSTNPEYATGLTLWQHEKCRELVLHRRQEADSENLLLAKHDLREMIDLEFKKAGATRRTHKRLARFMEQHGSAQRHDAPTKRGVGPGTSATRASDPAAPAGPQSCELRVPATNAAIPRFTPVVRKQEKP